MDEAKKIFENIEYVSSSEKVADQSDALLILTEWPEFSDLDMKAMRDKVSIVIDGRNLFEPKRMKQLGYHYDCMGRPLKN